MFRAAGQSGAYNETGRAARAGQKRVEIVNGAVDVDNGMQRQSAAKYGNFGKRAGTLRAEDPANIERLLRRCLHK